MGVRKKRNKLSLFRFFYSPPWGLERVRFGRCGSVANPSLRSLCLCGELEHFDGGGHADAPASADRRQAQALSPLLHRVK